jgi:hypothetical protein
MALNAKTDPTYSPKRIHGKFAPGYSGNPGGSLEATRRSFNKDFLLALATDFKQHGASAIAKVRKQHPAAYMKICALLVPREMRLEHTGGVKAMSDEQIEQAIEAIQGMLAARAAGEGAKVIDAVPEPVALPAPSRKPRRKRGAEAKASPLLPDEQGEERIARPRVGPSPPGLKT